MSFQRSHPVISRYLSLEANRSICIRHSDFSLEYIPTVLRLGGSVKRTRTSEWSTADGATSNLAEKTAEDDAGSIYHSTLSLPLTKGALFPSDRFAIESFPSLCQ